MWFFKTTLKFIFQRSIEVGVQTLPIVDDEKSIMPLIYSPICKSEVEAEWSDDSLEQSTIQSNVRINQLKHTSDHAEKTVQFQCASSTAPEPPRCSSITAPELHRIKSINVTAPEKPRKSTASDIFELKHNNQTRLKECEWQQTKTELLLSKLDSLIDKLSLEETIKGHEKQREGSKTPQWTYCRAIWCYNRNLRFVMHQRNDTNDCQLCNCRVSNQKYFPRIHPAQNWCQPSQLHSMSLRQELREVRRRMVACTASPCVAQSLSFSPNKCQVLKHLSPDSYNLPGENWVWCCFTSVNTIIYLSWNCFIYLLYRKINT